jgi:hypothetical protein
MTAEKRTESLVTKQVTAGASLARKPWKKKTPVEVVLDQINHVREDVTRREEELKLAKRQLQKLEEARKVLETS